jgi:hypothetical protein
MLAQQMEVFWLTLVVNLCWSLEKYRVSNNNCFSWQKKKFTYNFQDCELYLFRFVLLILLTAGIDFKFKRLGFRNLLLIKWFSRWNMT